MRTTLQDLGPGTKTQETLSIKDAKLVVVEGVQTGTALPLDRETTRIGRGHWCDFVLSEDPLASKEHCEIQLQKAGIVVKDLGSRNGIYINNVRVLEAFLSSNDQLRVGSSVMQVHLQESKKEIELLSRDDSHRLVGQSKPMRQLFAQLRRLAPQSFPVVFTGETGTGKTSMARAMHEQSQRANGPFVVINCASLSLSLMESLFFGYEKGAFTGADKLHRGYFEQARGGTLLLDELGELPPSLQPKLLDVLERKKIKRLGSEKEFEVDVRILASTHRNLAQEVMDGRFREDLYYRLAIVELHIPAIRDRPDDIPMLANHLLKEIEPEQELYLTEDATRALQQHLWPGNVRQLGNVLRRSLALRSLSEGVSYKLIDKNDLQLPPVEVSHTEARQPKNLSDPSSLVPSITHRSAEEVGLKKFLESCERHVLEEMLNKTGWNVREAAERLDITRAWLHRRVKQFDLTS